MDTVISFAANSTPVGGYHSTITKLGVDITLLLQLNS